MLYEVECWMRDGGVVRWKEKEGDMRGDGIREVKDEE